MSKRKKMHVDFSPDADYELIEISTNLPEYRLCFNLNQRLKWKLARLEDMKMIEGKNNVRDFCIFHYLRDEYSEIFLLGNSCGEKFLMSSFYLIINGVIRENVLERILQVISETEGVLSANKISKQRQLNAAKTASTIMIENILVELEYHLLHLASSE